MTLLYRHARFNEHDTGNHPESAVRLVHIEQALDSSGAPDRCDEVIWSGATDATLQLVHPKSHVAQIERLAAAGGGRVDPDTVVSPASADIARLAAGAVSDAVTRVARGDDRTALCLVRPPGHHALAARAMGFCLFNNIAVGAATAVELCELDRVLIVDWDVHHGNGTQDVFYGDSNVGFFSCHRWPFYPGTGASDETGAGNGLGATLNLPTSFGTSRRDYLARFASELETFADHMKPQLVLVSAGFDSHAADPIGSLGLETEDFVELTRIVKRVAAAHSAGRIVSVLEGGYNPPVLGECIVAHLEELSAGDEN